MKVAAWVWFAVVQLVSLAATVVGWVVLAPACLLHLWGGAYPSVKPLTAPRRLTCDWWLGGWCNPLNWLYRNPEDGVSGQQAWIWEPTLVPYLPTPSAWERNKVTQWLYDSWRAWAWSAWRNSSDNLKYVFRWRGGPSIRWESPAHSLYIQAGWNGSGFPTLSAGKL